MPKPTAPRWSVFALALAMGLSSLAATIVNIALPALADALSSPLQQVQWILLAYLICVTALVVVAGRLADIVGPKRLLKAGILLFTLGSGLCAAAPDLELLVAARAVQGAGAAIMTALSLALVGAGAPKDRIGSAMGMLGGVAALGTALGPVLGGALLAGFGWRALFLVNLPLGLLAFLLASRHLPDDAPPAAGGWKRFDFAGALLLGSSLTAYALAMTPGRGGFGAASGALASAAALLFGLFLVAQAKTATPLVRLALLRDRTVGPGLAMSAVVMTVLMATLVVGPFYLARGLGLGPALTGLVLSTGPAVAALAGVPAGRLVDRYGARAAALAGLVAVGAGCLLLSLAPPTLGAGAYAGPIALVTAGYALFQAGNNSAVMAEAAPGERGVVSGMLTLSRNLGLITGASAMAALFGLASGVSDLAAAPAEAVVAGFRTTMAVGALLAFGALILSLASHLRDPRREFGVT